MQLRIFVLLILIPSAFGCTTPKKTAVPEVINLHTEYLPNPVGMDILSPRLSWQMKKDKRGARQTAYRIMAATSEDLLAAETPDLWDSGKIESDRSNQVVYNGKALKSRLKVFWKVKIWDENKKKSVWSKTAEWEMGLLTLGEWQAKWIGALTQGRLGVSLPHGGPLSGPCRCFIASWGPSLRAV